MANQGSVTMSGLTVTDSNVQVQRRPAPLQNPAEQQSGAEAPVSRIGSKNGVDTYRVAPSSNYAPHADGINDGLATDSTVAPDMPLSREIKPVDFKTIEGSYPGDHRVIGKPAVLPTMPTVRGDMAQAPAGKNTPSQPLPFRSSTAGTEGDRA